MNEDYAEDKSTLTSKFNEAKLKTIRLHNAWVQANTYRHNGNFKGVRWVLDTIWDELYGVLVETNKLKDFEKEIEGVDEEISKAIERTDQYVVLRQKYRLLKKAQESTGMGGSIMSSEMDNIEE